MRHSLIHSKMKNYACETCQKTFSRKDMLDRHTKNHPMKQNFTCNICQKNFSRKNNLERHIQTHLESKSFICNTCQKTFSDKYTLTRHSKVHIGHQCVECDLQFTSRRELMIHNQEKHKPQKKKTYSNTVTKPKRECKSEAVLDCFEMETFLPSEGSTHDLIIFFSEINPLLQKRLEKAIEDHRNIKWYAVMEVTMYRIRSTGEIERITPFFRSSCLRELIPETIQDHIQDAFAKISSSFDEFTHRGSGWILEKIHKMDLNMARYRPFAYIQS